MPERSCVVCRKKAQKNELLRFVGAEQRPFFCLDVSGVREGRGAYVHPTPSCFGSLKFGAKIVRTLSLQAPGHKAWSKEEERTAFIQRCQQLDEATCGDSLRKADKKDTRALLRQLLKSCEEYLGRSEKQSGEKENRSGGDAKKQGRVSARPKVRL